MPSTNANGKPTADAIRNAGAIPWASQIRDDSNDKGNSVGVSLGILDGRKKVVVEDLSIETLNNEQSQAIGGEATEQFAPITAIVHMKDVGAGAAANGDVQISIGIAPSGTEILAATACTNLIAVNTKFIIDLSAVVKPSIPANSTIYVKVTTADTTAGAGHLADVHVVGEIFEGGA